MEDRLGRQGGKAPHEWAARKLLAPLVALLASALVPAVMTAPARAAEPFTISARAPAYLPPGYEAGGSVVTGDFNRDGNKDIAFTTAFGRSGTSCPSEELETGCVSVLLGTGDGSFRTTEPTSPLYDAQFPNSPVNYKTGGSPSFSTGALATGDVNGDGIPDLVVANREGNDSPQCAIGGCVAILYGNGHGSFEPAVGVWEGIEGSPQAVAIGDFNGDGHNDIAVATSTGDVYILLYDGTEPNGHATFRNAFTIPLVSSPSFIAGITTANLAGHGPIDLALSTGPSGPGQGECTVIACVQTLIDKHDGTGGFEPAKAYEVEGSGQIAAGDLRHLGVDDIVLPFREERPILVARTPRAATSPAAPHGPGFQVLLNANDSHGTLVTPPAIYGYEGAQDPSGIALGDFDGDGVLDVAVGDGGNPVIPEAALPPIAFPFTALFHGTGDGTFTPAGQAADPEHLEGVNRALATADFNGDCRLDIVAAGPAPQLRAGNRALEPAPAASSGGAVALINQTGGTASRCPARPAPPATTTTTTTTTTSPAPAPRIEVKSERASLAIVHAKIAASGVPVSCTRAGLRLRLAVRVTPRAIALRRSHGRAAVNVHVVVKLNGRKIAVRSQRSFTLRVPLGQFGVGRNTLTIIATASGHGIRRARSVRKLRFSRCLPAPKFTG